MAGSTTYPEAVDNKTPVVDGVDVIQADDVNDAYVPLDAIQTFLGVIGKAQSWATDVLEFLLNNGAPQCTKASGSTISVSAGTVMIGNSGQSVRLPRRNTSATTVTAANIDTGSLVIGGYYIFAVADSSATTFTVKFSTSSTAPTGLTQFELIGWFYNQANGALDITLPYVGNVKKNGRDVPNEVTISGTTTDTINDTSYGSDLTEVTARIYTTGRPIEISFTASSSSMDSALTFIVDLNGSDQTTSERGMELAAGKKGFISLLWCATPAAGFQIVIIQAKVGASDDPVELKHLRVKEL